MQRRHITTALCSLAFAAITYNSALAGTVFVPEGSGNSLLMVDADTGKPIRRIDGLDAVHGLGGAPGVPILVAGSYSETSRDEIAAAQAPKGVSSDQHAAHHAAKAARALGPSDAGLSVLSVIDAKNGNIIRRIEVSGAVHHVAVSPDGKFAVATHPATGGISVVDLTSYKQVAWIATGAMPNYAVFGNDPQMAYVSNAGNGTVSEVDLAHGIVRRNMLAGETPEHLAISPKRGTLYVADANAGKVLELGLTDGAVRRSFDIGGDIHGLGLSGDANRLYVAGRGEDKLVAIDLANGKMTSKPLGPEPYHLTPVPGANRLFVSSRAKPEVWIVDASSLAVTGEFTVSGEGHQMVALP
jgi:outer membrane protein assembly factor BamB